MSTKSTKANTTIYGNPISQPSRAVLWAAAIKKLDFEFKLVEILKGESQQPSYKEKFPAGFVPGLEVKDEATGKSFNITEAAAVLTYLAEANGWTDLYPTGNSVADLQQRAEIQKWLNWYHGGLRFATTEVVRPALGAIFKPKSTESATVVDPEVVKKEAAEKAAKDKEIAGLWKEALTVMTESSLKKQPFLAGDHCTLADIFCYCEIDQIVYTNAYDFTAWPEVNAWIQRMKELPEHDTVRTQLFKFINDFGLKRPDVAAQ